DASLRLMAILAEDPFVILPAAVPRKREIWPGDTDCPPKRVPIATGAGAAHLKLQLIAGEVACSSTSVEVDVFHGIKITHRKFVTARAVCGIIRPYRDSGIRLYL